MNSTFTGLFEQLKDALVYMADQIRAALIHALGGYTADECVVHPDKIERLCVTRKYTMSSMLNGRFEYNEARLKAGLMNMLVDHIRPFVVFEAYQEQATDMYVTRAMLRVINDNGCKYNKVK